MRHWKIVSLLAFALFAILTAQYASAQENTTSKVASTDAPLKVGGDVLPPVLIHSANPKFVRGLRTAATTAVVQVGLIVNTAGKPTNIHIVKSSNSVSLIKAA